jgi:hypothetical protein
LPTQRYESIIDPYHNIKRLNLYRFDGSPLQPMYLAYNPPKMLPTQTLNPTSTSTPGATATGKSSKFKRFAEEPQALNHKTLQKRWTRTGWADADRWWWFGVFCTGLGSVLYYLF